MIEKLEEIVVIFDRLNRIVRQRVDSALSSQIFGLQKLGGLLAERGHVLEPDDVPARLLHWVVILIFKAAVVWQSNNIFFLFFKYWKSLRGHWFLKGALSYRY